MKKMIMIAVGILLTIIIGIFFINEANPDTEVTKEVTRVGFIYNGEMDDHGWGQSHYEGITASAAELNLEIIYRENVPFDATSMETMENMIAQGCEIIICNSYNYGEWIHQVAAQNPEVVFFHATGVENAPNVTTYFGRMYQIRYLCGIVAGMQTQTDEIGYVAAYAIPEVNRGINAFTLGVRSVNPEAEVHVMFSESWTEDEANGNAARELIENQNIDVIAMHCDSIAPLEVAEQEGVWSIGYNMDNSALYPSSFLTAAVWNWEEFYTPQIMTYLQGKFHADNYWEGIESDLIDLAPLTEHVAPETAAIVEEKMELLNSGSVDVFYGPIWDNEGELRIGEGESMPDEAMLNSFDWYVEGVVIYE